jgi:hypothetical protein
MYDIILVFITRQYNINIRTGLLLCMTSFYSIITWCFSYWPSYRTEVQPNANTADRGPITRPIWKTSCNDTFIN